VVAVAVMGGGSFGTAIAGVMADSGQRVRLWTIEPEVVAEINASHTNEKYHPGAKLPDAVSATSDELEALAGADLVVLAIPAQLVGDNLRRWQNHWSGSPLVVSVMKGIELGSMRRMSEVIEQDGGINKEKIAVISGPNLAKEIVRRQPAATTVASVDEAAAKLLQDAVTTEYFRPYFTTDVIGCEIGGAVKNVIALANGMAVGLGFGDNTQASLITRGLAEMSRLGAALGANPMTFLGLAGMGDLVATCTSPLSRNRTFGENLGKGLTVQETIAITNQTAEGVKSCQPILQLAQSVNVEMPITEQVVKVVTEGMSPQAMLGALMTRQTKAEQGMSD
jgi:glycerol-3-phosphate dehydrogenase (NAD(P)+)